MEVVGYSVRKGVEKGFKTWIYDEYAWPSGRAGSTSERNGQTPARVPSAGPEHHAKSLVRNIHDAEGPVQVALEGRYPDGEPLVRLAARIDTRGALDPKTFTDLTAATSWNCPDGKWRILSFAVASFKDHIDYLRAPTVKLFIETTYEAYAERHRDEFGKGIPGVFFDEPSIAARPMPWTDALANRFKKDKGYSLLEKLPMLVQRAGPETVKVRCDFYDTVAALYEEAWFKQISAWCERHRLLWAGHTEEHVAHHAARQGDYFRTMRHVTVPGTDIHSYRYARPRTIQAAEVKSAVSIAAMLNRERVMAEAFGGAGWGVTLDDVKHGANLLAALGVDMTVMHGFHYTLDSAEAADDWPNSFSFHNPYWENFGELSTYIARLSALVNKSTATTTVGVLYPITGVWANTADGRPNARARELGQTYEDLIDGLFARGVDVHVIDETFVTGARLEKGVLRQGKLTIDLVILPPTPALQRATARRLQAFANGGGRVIAVGERATGSSDAGGGDRSVTRVMRELFKRDASGKRGDKVGSGRTHGFAADDPKLLDSLRDVIDPATQIGSDATDIALASREIDGAQLAIIVNSAANQQKVTIDTRATGGAELWDPETGAMSALSMRGTRTRRSFELMLPPHAAQIVVFDASAQASRAARAPRRRRGRKVGMDSDWQFVLETGLETGPGSVRRLELPGDAIQRLFTGRGTPGAAARPGIRRLGMAHDLVAQSRRQHRRKLARKLDHRGPQATGMDRAAQQRRPSTPALHQDVEHRGAAHQGLGDLRRGGSRHRVHERHPAGRVRGLDQPGDVQHHAVPAARREHHRRRRRARFGRADLVSVRVPDRSALRRVGSGRVGCELGRAGAGSGSVDGHRVRARCADRDLGARRPAHQALGTYSVAQ